MIDLADVFNGAINRLYGAGLSIAAVLSRTDVDDDVRGHLYEALDELDSVVAALRTATFNHFVGGSDGLDSSLPLYLEAGFAYPAPDSSLAPAPMITSNPPMTTLEDVIE